MDSKKIAILFTTGLILFGSFGINAYAQENDFSKGLVKLNNTTYVHYDSDHNISIGWHNEYHFNNSNPSRYGYMDYGWYTDNTGTYFLNTAVGDDFGKKVKGWQWIDGYRYFFDEHGRLIFNKADWDELSRTNEKGQWTVNGVVQFFAGRGFQSDITQSKPGQTLSQQSTSSVPALTNGSAPSSGNTALPKGDVNGYIAPLPSSIAKSNTSNPVTPPNETEANVKRFVSDVLIIETQKNIPETYVSNAVAPYGGRIEKAFDSINTYKIKFGTVSDTRLIEIKNTLQFDSNFTSVHLDMISSLNP